MAFVYTIVFTSSLHNFSKEGPLCFYLLVFKPYECKVTL